MSVIAKLLEKHQGTLVLNKSFNNQVVDLTGINLKGGRTKSSFFLMPDTQNIHVVGASVSKAVGVRNKGQGNTFDSCDINAYGVGLYVYKDCHDTKITNCTIRAGGVGIYLDTGSTGAVITKNTIKDCGHWLDNASFDFSLPRFGWLKREGIAIDDSRANIISGNTIDNCGLAGITLYRNCAEYGTQERGAGSRENNIHDNSITRCPVDIWEDAREWRDMLMWDCGDKGQWVEIKDVPKQPFQQWFNWECLIYPLTDKQVGFKNPFRTKIWKVSDIVESNSIRPDGEGENILVDKD